MTEATLPQAHRWMNQMPRDQFDLLLLILREREAAEVANFKKRAILAVEALGEEYDDTFLAGTSAAADTIRNLS